MTDIDKRVENWVFLGDSLTEGVGSSRISYVNELAEYLRQAAKDQSVHVMRLRQVNPSAFDRFVQFNLAGFLTTDQSERERSLWLWNFACEGRTIENDREWFPLLANLRPSLVVLLRGGLESIIRPTALRSNCWPWWVPSSWRVGVSMDPRCYFSTTWWRYAKQRAIDAIKQKTRLRLLAQSQGIPLMDADTLLGHYRELVEQLIAMRLPVLVLGLIPPMATTFPGSIANFQAVNHRLREMTGATGAEFFDWDLELPQGDDRHSLFYRDGFHPNAHGARIMGQVLAQYLVGRMSV